MLKVLFSLLGLGDKSLHKSVTVWGLVLWGLGDAIVTTLCGTPELTFNGELVASSDACGVANTLVQKLGVVLTALGIRKAAK